MWKKNWPGKVDTSAAGHYRAGEGIEGGLRELAEEVGVLAKEEDLIDVNTRIAVSELEKGVCNHEFQDVRFLIDDRPLEKYKVSFPEVDGLILLCIKDGLALLSNEIESVEAEGFEIQNTEDGQKQVYKTFRLTRDDFIPSLDHFHYKVFILADRIMRGEKHLHI